ncbi:MAG: response regulator [Cyanobacteria bacterium P01_A01_bin.123]
MNLIPNLIIDMQMPVMNGYEATQQIKVRRQGQATTIIALTVSILEEEDLFVLAVGCDDFVSSQYAFSRWLR